MSRIEESKCFSIMMKVYRNTDVEYNSAYLFCSVNVSRLTNRNGL